MAHSVEIMGVEYVPSNTAGSKIGYSSDYVARLAREGKIEATRVGRQWFVNPISLENFYSNANREKKNRQKKLRQARIAERKKSEQKRTVEMSAAGPQTSSTYFEAARDATALGAALRSGVVTLTGLLVGVFFYYGEAFIQPTNLNAITSNSADQLSDALSAFVGGVMQNLSPRLSNNSANRMLPAMLPEGVESVSSAGGEFEDVREGVVVIPEGADAEDVLAEVASSFSDEVVVSRDSDNPETGVITPVFKERTGDDYRFLLVPVTEAAVADSP